MRERALALIAIAHPDFRAELLEAAKRHHLVYDGQMMTPVDVYPEEWVTEAGMRDSTRLCFRPNRPTDEELMQDLFYACYEATVYHRFFTIFPAGWHLVFCPTSRWRMMQRLGS